MSHNNQRDYTKYHNEIKAKAYTAPAPVEEVVAAPVVEAPVVEAVIEHDDQEIAMPIGVVVNCDRLNVRTQPSPMANVVCTIERGEKLAIDKGASTELFYKVYAEIGAEGYCMKQFIEIES